MEEDHTAPRSGGDSKSIGLLITAGSADFSKALGLSPKTKSLISSHPTLDQSRWQVLRLTDQQAPALKLPKVDLI